IITITPCIRFHKSIIKEKTVDIIHKTDFVYSLEKGLKPFSIQDYGSIISSVGDALCCQYFFSNKRKQTP
ncbi:hypothetical protein P7D58_22145, partial [Enterococcus avium]|uniref:hypothetical protein n=1 Tax=Enterococcus avium TaxID=33945 RepID=UPI00288EFCFA